MRRSPFSTDFRALLCEACSAAIEAPIAGGALSCPRCGHASTVGPRPQEAKIPRTSAPVDEATRLARLRQQDGRPLVPPDAVRRLMSGSNFDPARVDEAFAIYHATCREIRATSSPDAAERLYLLTIIANNHFAEHEDPQRRRALLETSLEHAFLPRHKQFFRSMLATAAGKVGDMQAAEQWLAPCDPYADDIDSDSAYRNARAYLDTVNHNWRAVLTVLGARDDEIPILDARDPVCAVLRANAHERLGDVATAVAVLRARMGKENASGRITMERFIAQQRELSLCELSFPEALRGHNEVAAKAAAGQSGGMIGTILIAAGGFSLLIGLIIGLAVPIQDPIQRLPMMIGPSIAAFVLIPMGLKLRSSAREAAFLRQHGLPATGVVVRLDATGTRINNVPLMQVTVTVKRPDAQPYQASFRQLLRPEHAAQFQAGVEVPLRVHPQKPDKVMMETV